VTLEAQADPVASVQVAVGSSDDARAGACTRVAEVSGPGRVEWVDAAKGIGIVLVVFAHDLRGLQLVDGSPLASWADHFIYAFHMPLFFVLAGLFAGRSVRRGARAFVTEKIRTLAYPYFLWSVLQGVLQLAMKGETNSQMSWSDLAAIPYQPVMQFWFLYTLFLVFMLFLVCHQLRMPSWGILALGVGLSWLSSTAIPPRGEIHSLTIYFVYFAFGLHFSDSLRREVGRAHPVSSLGAAVVAFAVLAFLAGRLATAWPLAVVAAVLGTTATLLVARATTAVPGLGFLRTWGSYSLQIYVAHSIVSAAVRIALHRMGVQVPILHLVLGTAAGILAPIALARLAERIGFELLFCWPSQRRVAA